MKFELIEIPDVNLDATNKWKICALEINNRSPILKALIEWKRKRPDDYKKIFCSMKLVAVNDRVVDPKHVKKTSNPSKHGDVYEMRAHKGLARLFFFYDDQNERVVVCTNEYIKGKGDQNNAFAQCGKLKRYYQSQ